jgi:hypothetical protein
VQVGFEFLGYKIKRGTRPLRLAPGKIRIPPRPSGRRGNTSPPRKDTVKNNDGFVDPPARVRKAESLGTLMAHAGALNKEINRNDKANVQHALEVGRTLVKARPLCPAGRRLKELEKAGISRQRASEFMRGASAPADVQVTWESVHDLKRWLADNGHDQGGMSTGGHTGQDESEEEKPPPDRPRVFSDVPSLRATVHAAPREDAEPPRLTRDEVLGPMKVRAVEFLKAVRRECSVALQHYVEGGPEVLRAIENCLAKQGGKGGK